MKRSTRLFACWLAMLALVFAQLATAAYACPQDMERGASAAVSGACDHEMAQTPNLCERHCDYGKASVDKAKAFTAPDLAAAPCPFFIAPARTDAPRAVMRSPASTGPPLTRFTVLRI